MGRLTSLNSGVEWLNGGAEWLNGRSEWWSGLAIQHVMSIHIDQILVPMNSACHAGHFDTWLIFL